VGVETGGVDEPSPEGLTPQREALCPPAPTCIEARVGRTGWLGFEGIEVGDMGLA